MADDVVSTEPRTTVAGTAFTTTFLRPDGSSELAAVHVRNDHVQELGVDLVIFFHGLNGDHDNFIGNNKSRTVAHALLDNSRYILCESNAQGQNFGNDASLDDYFAVYDYVTRTYNIESVFLIGQSMGGIASLLALHDGRFENVKAWVGIAALTNLTEANTQRLKDAYGYTNDSDYEVVTAGHDPMLYAASDYLVAFRAYASYDDPTVQRADNSDLFIALCTLANEAEVVACSGTHISNEHYQPSDVLEFFSRARLAEPGVPPAEPEEEDVAELYYFEDGQWVPAVLYWFDGIEWHPARLVRA